MSDEADEVVPDQPLDTLVDEVDHEVREETRETSRASLKHPARLLVMQRASKRASKVRS